jgi:CYTH domain-containing protein
MPSGLEIERKFLLGALPAAIGALAATPIRQGYVALDGDTEVRVRLTSDTVVLTIKSGRGGVRTEEEVTLDARQGEALWRLTEGRRIEKTRRRAPYGEVEIEVDEYAGTLAGLLVAEVEFDGEAASRGFEPPGWFGPEVTGDRRYANRSLASDGLPADHTVD